MEGHTFCRLELAEVKQAAKDAGIQVGKLTVWRSDSNPIRPQFEIYQDGKQQPGYITAHCAADAKCKFISRLIEAETTESIPVELIPESFDRGPIVIRKVSTFNPATGKTTKEGR